MLNQLIELDQHLFFAINQVTANLFFDWLMPILRERLTWVPLYLFLAFILIKKYGKYGVVMLLFFVLSFGIADFFSASIIKPFVERLRPCNDPIIKLHVRSLVPCGSGYSFPSTHASNHFAMGVFLITLFYRRWKWIMPLALLWAVSISFAQVYVGLHYPIDITFGALLGGTIGYTIGTILKKIIPYQKWKTGN